MLGDAVAQLDFHHNHRLHSYHHSRAIGGEGEAGQHSYYTGAAHAQLRPYRH